MSCRWPAGAALIAFLASCGGGPGSVERIAILPLDNQSADGAASWVGDGVAQLAATQLAGAPKIAAINAGDRQEAVRLRASSTVVGYWTGTPAAVRARVEVRSVEGKHRRAIEASGSPAAVAHAIAAALWDQAPQQPSAGGEALRLYIEGIRGRNEQLLQEAVAASPDFGPAWYALGQLQILRGDRGKGLETMQAALLRPGLDALSRARCEVAASQGTSREARLTALETVTRAMPAHAEGFVQAGSAAFSDRRFPEAAKWFDIATQLDPQAAEPWNELGYARAFAGDLDGALTSLREYEKLSPGSANPLDSLGEVYFAYGRFAESAQAFVDAYTKDPGLLRAVTLRKAAEADRMAGDNVAAAANFARYRDALGKHPLAGLIEARWQYSNGDKAGAIAALRKLAEEGNASPSWAQLAIWLAAGGGDGRAAALRAKETAKSPADLANAVVAEFVTQPKAAAEEWRARAEAVPAPLRGRALAYSLLIHGQFKEAIPALEAVTQTPTLTEYCQMRALTGWALLQSGETAKGKALLDRWPLPSSEPGLFDWLLFPAVREWKR